VAHTVIVQLTDDFDGGQAAETISFALNGKSYEIDLNKENAERLREAFAPFVEKARNTSRGKSGSRTPSDERPGGIGTKTLFSTLDAEEKERFRAWAKMPTARRVSDAKVQGWIDSGRP
jgi:hypothetical protein